MASERFAPPVLVIVMGLPGSGKSSLARRLADRLSLPLIQKDIIKETLCDVLACATLEQSRQYGYASMTLLYRFAEVVLKSGQSCIIESYFHPALAAQDLLQLRQRSPFSPLQIYCRADRTILAERVRRRWESGERHRGHMENLRDPDWHQSLTAEDLQPLPLDGPVIELDTTDFAAIDYERLFCRVQEVWMANPFGD